jgi:hypothetical protein
MSTLFYSALYVAWLAIFIWLILKWRYFEIENVSRKHLALFFSLKVAAGIFLTLIYTYYYTDTAKADIYRYFNDSKVISPLLFSHPVTWFKIMTGIGIDAPEVFNYYSNTHYFDHPGADMVTNNRFIIRVIVLLNYFSFSNIHINTLLFNFISFIGLTALLKALRPYFSAFIPVLYLPLFLLPAVVFWSSGLLKETLLFAGLGFYIYGVLSYETFSKRILWILSGALIVLLIKLHVFALLLLCSVFLPIKGLRISVLVRAMVLVLILVAAFVFAGESISNNLLEKRNEFVELARLENAGSFFDSRTFLPTTENLVKLLPEAVVNSIFRPFLWDTGKLFQKVFALENLLFFALLLIPLRYFQRPEGDKLLLCLFCLSFALFNYLVIGITIPLIGAIVHYRVIGAPFLMIAVLLCADLEKWRAVFRR